MEICYGKTELRAARQRLAGRVGLVPTMGYLHDGHMRLVARARAENDAVVATIFVNPSQFGPNEDLATYPRDLERDLDLLRAAGVDLVFAPAADEMYRPDSQTTVETAHLSRILIGRLRPGHFRGVATIVTKLFNIVQPDAAYFGQKDYQQLAVIRTMARDLDVPVEIVGVPTVREADGLAMSSRNVRLTPDARSSAPALNEALELAERHAPEPIGALKRRIRDHLDTVPGAVVASVDIRDADTLAPVSGLPERPVVILLAVRFGDVLLIDNRVIEPKDPA